MTGDVVFWTIAAVVAIGAILMDNLDLLCLTGLITIIALFVVR